MLLSRRRGGFDLIYTSETHGISGSPMTPSTFKDRLLVIH